MLIEQNQATRLGFQGSIARSQRVGKLNKIVKYLMLGATKNKDMERHVEIQGLKKHLDYIPRSEAEDMIGKLTQKILMIWKMPIIQNLLMHRKVISVLELYFSPWQPT